MIGHAHDNCVDSENVAGVHEQNNQAHIIFLFENVQGNKNLFFTIYAQNTAETSQPQSQLTDD